MDLHLLEYEVPDGLRAFSTQRGEGGGPYASFNITHYCGDDAAHVSACRARLCTELGIDDARLLLPLQVHRTDVLTVGADFLAAPAETRRALLDGKDALVTDTRGVCIGVSTADCVPVLLYDLSAGVIAAAHAGWRSMVGHVITRTAEAMSALGASAAHTCAIIGPSIGPDSFEVGEEVAEAFLDAGFSADVIDRNRPRPYVDLWSAAREELCSLGVGAQNVCCAAVDTYADHARFFSARRLGKASGRIFSGIMRGI